MERSFSHSTLRVMTEYDWPGERGRELETRFERACALSSGRTWQMGDLPMHRTNFRLQQGPAVRTTEDRRTGLSE